MNRPPRSPRVRRLLTETTALARGTVLSHKLRKGPLGVDGFGEIMKFLVVSVFLLKKEKYLVKLSRYFFSQ